MAVLATGSRRIALVVGVMTLALTPGAAQADHVGCGDVLTQDTTLDSDLVNCPGDGLVIGADGITLDLGGHTIDGVPGSGGNGVEDAAGHDRVTVTNGTVRDFQAGVNLIGADRSQVTRLELIGNGTGTYLERANANVIERSTFSGSGIVVFVGSNDNVISANSVSGPGTAIFLWGGLIGQDEVRGTRVERNRLTENAVGLIVYLGTADTVVRGNEMSGNTDIGVAVAGTLTVLERNAVSENGLGVHISGSHTRVLRNRVLDNDGDGIFLAGGGTSFHNVVEDNVASGNGDDGIDAENAEPAEPQHTITRNTANDNGDYGIEAAAGVTDGGGNKARGNGNPAQCLNVVCR